MARRCRTCGQIGHNRRTCEFASFYKDSSQPREKKEKKINKTETKGIFPVGTMIVYRYEYKSRPDLFDLRVFLLASETPEYYEFNILNGKEFLSFFAKASDTSDSNSLTATRVKTLNKWDKSRIARIKKKNFDNYMIKRGFIYDKDAKNYTIMSEHHICGNLIDEYYWASRENQKKIFEEVSKALRSYFKSLAQEEKTIEYKFNFIASHTTWYIPTKSL